MSETNYQNTCAYRAGEPHAPSRLLKMAAAACDTRPGVGLPRNRCVPRPLIICAGQVFLHVVLLPRTASTTRLRAAL